MPFEEIIRSIKEGEIIEQYPEDKPYPSCLILSKNKEGDAMHTVWAYNGITHSSVLITVYRPNPAQWKNLRARRKE